MNTQPMDISYPASDMKMSSTSHIQQTFMPVNTTTNQQQMSTHYFQQPVVNTIINNLQYEFKTSQQYDPLMRKIFDALNICTAPDQSKNEIAGLLIKNPAHIDDILAMLSELVDEKVSLTKELRDWISTNAAHTKYWTQLIRESRNRNMGRQLTLDELNKIITKQDKSPTNAQRITTESSTRTYYDPNRDPRNFLKEENSSLFARP